MNKKELTNRLEFKVSGNYALFTRPETRVSGEKCSYHLPTYQSLVGVVQGIYWKPTIMWYIDKVRVMKQIQTETKGIKYLKYEKEDNVLSYYTYLKDVEYHVSAHYEWNMHNEAMAQDRKDWKHNQCAYNFLKKGGKNSIFLGVRECAAYVEACDFEDGEGYYDNSKEIGYGLMFHGFDYPTETGKEEFGKRFWNCTMKNGVVEFIRPEECKIRYGVRPMPMKFTNSNTVDYELDMITKEGNNELVE